MQTKISKSLIDFDSYEELLELVNNYKPGLIGIRAMTFYSGFFHDGIAFLRDNGIDAVPTEDSPLQKLIDEMPFDEKQKNPVKTY